MLLILGAPEDCDTVLVPLHLALKAKGVSSFLACQSDQLPIMTSDPECPKYTDSFDEFMQSVNLHTIMIVTVLSPSLIPTRKDNLTEILYRFAFERRLIVLTFLHKYSLDELSDISPIWACRVVPSIDDIGISRSVDKIMQALRLH